MWLKELNFFLNVILIFLKKKFLKKHWTSFFQKKDSKNWTLLVNMTQRIEPFFKKKKKQRLQGLNFS